MIEELSTIKSLDRKDNIILVDDFRIITTSFPWGENSHGNNNFLQAIKSQILSINKDYKFTTLNGYVKNNVVMAYIPSN